MRIYMGINNAQFAFPRRVCSADGNRSCHRQTGTPRTFFPRQINPRYITEREPTEQCDSCVAGIIESDGFLEVEPPLPGLWFLTARNSRRHVNPVHSQLFC